MDIESAAERWRGADALMFVYSLTDARSFEQIDALARKLRARNR